MKNIKRLRLNQVMTREQLSKVSGVSVETIKKLESGLLKTNNCKLSTLVRLASGLNCKVVDLIPNKLVKYIC